ncbi:MAG: penicillin-binding transpeptidase domain-containing protein [Clostridia bacterium]
MQAKALDQWTRDLPITARRGDIVDTNGVTLVTSQTCYGVYIRAKNILEPEKVASVLSQKLDVSYEGVLKKAKNKGVSEITIKRQVEAQTIAELREFNLEGVYFAEESSRYYVYGDFLTQVLGFVSVDSVGQTGIEAQYDKYLRGIDGQLLTQADLVGKELPEREMYYVPSVDGLQVTLTIDYSIQFAVENTLNAIMYNHSPKSVKCIVMDVTNGQILALSSKPSFNLNAIPRDNITQLMEYSRNGLITDIFEPGSTFKVLTASATLEESSRGNASAFNADYIFKNNSNVRHIGGGKISCWTKHTNGKHCNQHLSQALNNSCNPIFTDIALSLGKETMYNYLQAFGYGSKTGVDFIGEQSGMLVPYSSCTEGDLARIGFGQSVAVTALQLCNATAAAINGGYLFKPYFVKKISDKDGKIVKEFYPTVINKVISSQTSQQLAVMLENVVTLGSGKQAYIKGYEVGGKTGTAQKYENGVIARGKNISSFVGFFPASSPKYLCFVMVDEPIGVSYGSVVAAPYARLIFEQIISLYNIPPKP